VNDTGQLKEAVRAFHDAGIKFVLIGGLAMIAHGANILTQDVDFAYAIDPENVERLSSFLATIHARVLGRPTGDKFVISPAIVQRVRFLNLATDLGAVDVMREVPGVDSFDGLWERAAAMDMDGFIVRVASLDDLIAMKRAADRPKDRNHLYELLALKKVRDEESV
jgi:predicted nucleotidyltransferase